MHDKRMMAVKSLDVNRVHQGFSIPLLNTVESAPKKLKGLVTPTYLLAKRAVNERLSDSQSKEVV
jgi:hypothetical protein